MPTTRKVSGNGALGSAAHYPDARSMYVCAHTHMHVHMHACTHTSTHMHV